ncbi:unnamed protein product [Somion occarium]|uniref:Uncharacterized protein n=1 Tax=Somion occarium TaxID=3059160 RepID=A0ABP1DQ19_9APHY
MGKTNAVCCPVVLVILRFQGCQCNTSFLYFALSKPTLYSISSIAMFSRLAIFMLLALSAVFVAAAPGHAVVRQSGNDQCDIDRDNVINDVAAAKSLVDALVGQLASDPAASQTIAQVESDLASTQDGINQILAALSAGQDPPDAAVELAVNGISNAFDRLTSITSTDDAITTNLNKAEEQLQAASFAGTSFLENCI